MSTEITDLFSVQGKTVLVTGGSRGIGEMIASAFVRAGAKVIITARSAEDCQTVCAALSEAGAISAIPADLSSIVGIEGLALSLDNKIDGLDVLINNAGVAWGASIDDYPEFGWDKTVNLNLKSPFFLCQKLLPQLRLKAAQTSSARIINIASIDGLHPPDFDTFAYSASKAGLIMLTQHLAKKLAREQIQVNAVAPGFFLSKMTEKSLETIEQDVIRSTPLGRLGQPDDIAGLTLFLASQASSFITGTCFPCDGGRSTCR